MLLRSQFLFTLPVSSICGSVPLVSLSVAFQRMNPDLRCGRGDLLGLLRARSSLTPARGGSVVRSHEG